MSIINRITVLLMILIALIFYYNILGPSAFPDYENYQTIVSNGGYLFSPDEYYFEWFSRGVLKFDFENYIWNVDILAIFSQVISIIYFLKLVKIKPWSGLLQAGLSSVLFLTTTIRAAPAYLFFGFAGLNNTNLKSTIILMLMAIAWHDSAILPFFIIIIVIVLEKFNLLGKLNYFFKIIYPLFIFGIIFPDLFRNIFISSLSGLIGIRESYLSEDGSYSVAKLCYTLLLYIISLLIIKKKLLNEKSIAILYAINIMSVGLYIINSVAGIRFSIYIIVFILASISNLKIENLFSKILIYFLSIFVYIYTYFDIIKNTL